MKNIDPRRVIHTATGLRSEDGENPEYDRAIVEMTTALLGFPGADKYLTGVLLGVTGQSLRALDPEDEAEPEVCSWQEVQPKTRPMWARIPCSDVVVRGGIGGAPLCTAHVEARDAQWDATRSTRPAATSQVFRTDEDGTYALSDCRWWTVIQPHRPGMKDCAGRMGEVTRKGGTVVIECEVHFNARNGLPT